MINYAHRGASSYAPENTYPAFDLGITMGANGIETDVQKTADGKLVLFHDDSLERITGLPAKINELTFTQLKKLDFGKYMGEQYIGTQIVMLEDFFIRYGQKNLTFAIELKTDSIEKEVCDLIHKYQLDHKAIITSFDLKHLITVRTFDKTISLGYLTDKITDQVLEKLNEHSISEICPRADILSKELCNKAHDRQFTVRAWGVKNYELMLHSCFCEVDGMTINFPDILQEYLSRQLT